jgi:16S rRNA (uracil1498-N3)-methyltransferase
VTQPGDNPRRASQQHGEPADEAGAVAHVFVDALTDQCTVSGPDGHHLQRVRRLTPGEIVTAADDTGAWRAYSVGAAHDARVELDARGDVRVAPALAVPLTLAVAVTKGGLDDLVAAATELGVARVIPLRTERAIVRWDAARTTKVRARLASIAREASCQSRRARIPVIEDPVDIRALRDRAGLVVADRGGPGPDALPAPPPDGFTVVVGPEGGLSPGELSELAAAPRLGLGPYVLRAHTAPVAALAVLTVYVASLRAE